MTKKEIEKFLDDTKVYVDGKSAEIQNKLFSFGYHWRNDHSKRVRYPDSPFLFIHRNKEILHSSDMVYFSSQGFRKITANKILSLEITEPSYRAFKSKEECWKEMHKHPDFGWVKLKRSSSFYHIDAAGTEVSIDNAYIKYQDCIQQFEFTDGTPFGIKED